MKSPMNRTLLAALAFGLVSGSAQALDYTEGGTGSKTHMYAPETVLATAASAITGGYYTVTDSTDLTSIRFDQGVTIEADDVGLIMVELNNLAFTGPPTIADWRTAKAVKAGDTEASFRYAGTGDLADTTADVTLTLATASIGVKPGMDGGIKITVINKTLEDALGAGKARSVAVNQPRAVYGVPSVTSAVRGARHGLRATAQVAHGFKSFDPGVEGMDLAATIGTVMIEVAATLGDDATTDDPATLAQISDFTKSKVKVMGNLGFAEKVTYTPAPIVSAKTCPGTSMTINDDMDMAEAVIGDATTSHFQTMQYICIQAKEDTVIPEASYTVDIDYVLGSIKDTVAPLADVVAEDAGAIVHNGTTIHIPYISTHARYNQRFQVVNNGPATTYAFTFMTEEGITATPGDAATGALPKGTIHLKLADIVTLSGGNRVSAYFTAVAKPANIEMSAMLVARDNGATDVTVFSP